MASGYKIKLEDGSLMGPMNIETLEGYFRQGLVRHDDMAQRPDSLNWVPLSEILARDVKKAAAAAKTAEIKKKVAVAPRPAPVAARPRPEPPRAAPVAAGPAPDYRIFGTVLKVLALLIVGAGLVAGASYGYRMVAEKKEADDRARQAAAEARAAEESKAAAAAQLAQARDALAAELPQFSRPTVDALVAQSSAQVLEPAEAFRRGQTLMSRGIGGLSAAESAELGNLMQVLYGNLAGAERGQLAAYLDTLRARGTLTKPEQDRAMQGLMKKAVTKLPAARRARLQALFDKAVKAGLAAKR
jgi:hypothetical protein